MIKINLLPVRAAKKKETLRQHVVILVISVSVVAVALIFFYTILLSKVSATKDRIAANEKDLQRLKTKIGEIENIKKLQDEVKKKLDILDKLRKGKAGPALRLAALSDNVPEKLWLTRYTESGPAISMSGMAFSEDPIKTFIENLESSKKFFDIELVVSEQAELGGVKVKKFDINAKLEPKKDEPKKDTAPKK